MAYTVTSESGHRSTLETIERPYYIYDDDIVSPQPVVESTAITSAYDQFFTEVGIAGTDHRFERINNFAARVWVIWEPSRQKRLGDPPLINGRNARQRFSYDAQPQFLRYSRSTTDIFPRNFTLPENMLGAQLREGNIVASGEEIRVPTVTTTWEFHVAVALMTEARKRRIYELCGTVCAPTPGSGESITDFANLPKFTIYGQEYEYGSMFMASCHGQQRDAERWVIQMGVALQINETGRTHELFVDNQPEQFEYDKFGHDHFWVLEQEVSFPTEVGRERIISGPIAGITSRVWPFEDWSDLNFLLL